MNGKYDGLRNEPGTIIKLNTAKKRRLHYRILFPAATKIYRTE